MEIHKLPFFGHCTPLSSILRNRVKNISAVAQPTAAMLAAAAAIQITMLAAVLPCHSRVAAEAAENAAAGTVKTSQKEIQKALCTNFA